jgi:UDP-2-acetamido-3-amino-2,3-dideoxy-glucuronate N-acetyltransferase
MSDIFIHPSAVVSEDAQIGDGTKIWVNSQVREKVVIGEQCIISKDTYIDISVTIGSRVKVQNGVSVWHGVTVEDDVFIGPYATFVNDRVPRAFDQNWKIAPTLIKNGASIGANATILCDVTVGEYAIVAAGSVVTKDVEPYSMVMGNPARHSYFVDKMGNRVD